MDKTHTRISLYVFAAVLALGAALPAFAATEPQVPGATDLVGVVIWTFIAIIVAGTVYGMLYLLKREVGGFPQPPSWIPPIDLMLSKNLIQDEPEHDHSGADEAAPSAH